MPLVSMTEQLANASAGGYAVAYCESWDLDSFQAVLQAALRTGPVREFRPAEQSLGELFRSYIEEDQR